MAEINAMIDSERSTIASTDIRYIDGADLTELIGDKVDDYVASHSGGFATQKDLNSLAYGDNCGGKNLLNPTLKGTTTVNGVTVTENDGTYTLNGTATSACYITFQSNISIVGRYKLVGCPTGGAWGKYGLWLGSASSNNGDFGNGYISDVNVSGASLQIIIWNGQTLSNVVFKPMLTTDLNATYDDFVPYIKSVKQLSQAQNDDLKMLGYTVPGEMPIQNYTDSDRKFHQRVGRVDLGSLEWTVFDGSIFYTSFTLTNTSNIFNKLGLKFLSWSEFSATTNGLYYESGNIYIKYNNYSTVQQIKSSLQGVYLYYPLATEIVTSVDGNEKATEIDEIKNGSSNVKNPLAKCIAPYDGFTPIIGGTMASGIVMAIQDSKLYIKTYDVNGNENGFFYTPLNKIG